MAAAAVRRQSEAGGGAAGSLDRTHVAESLFSTLDYDKSGFIDFGELPPSDRSESRPMRARLQMLYLCMYACMHGSRC